MRILTGQFKGLSLKSPTKDLRPTQDKVRKAIFDILGDYIVGANFLELFAGTGCVGIEALSCGAGFVLFVENEGSTIELLKDNLSRLKITNFDIKPGDAFLAVEQLARINKKFDIIFVDPPYYEELAKKALQTLSSYDILLPSGIVIIQHYKKDVIPETTGSLEIFKTKKYGDNVLSFYRKR